MRPEPNEQTLAAVRRASQALDLRSTGMVFALVAALVAVLVLGWLPTAIAVGVLALLVVD